MGANISCSAKLSKGPSENNNGTIPRVTNQANISEIDSNLPSPTILDTPEDLESEDDREIYDEAAMPQEPPNYGITARHSVSAEVFGFYNSPHGVRIPHVEKTAEESQRIRKLIDESFLFNSLKPKEKSTIINAFIEERISEGTRFIVQGEQGNKLYLIDSGEVKIVKKIGEEETHIGTLTSGDVVGELALIHNTERGASAIAMTPIVVWTLDRPTFCLIVREAATQRRQQYMSLLSKVVLLSNMSEYEVTKIADALSDREYPADAVVVQEGDPGDEFYMLVEGKAAAFKGDVLVAEYSEGSYFGELSLIKSQPRAATVKCITNCRILCLERKAFKRLLGPVEHILQRNVQQYQMVLQSLHLTHELEALNAG